MRLFQINWDRLVLLLLPKRMRAMFNFVFVRSMVQAVFTLSDKFRANRIDNLYKMSHNGQVCYLRAMLNDTFDVDHRRIRIEDTGRHDWIFVFNELSDKPILLDIVELASEQFTTDEGTDFTVFVPAEMSRGYRTQMISLINFYKLAGKRYSIVFE